MTSPFITVPEAAEIARVDPKTIRRAVANGHLRAFKPVRKILIREADVTAWIEGREIIPQPAIPDPRPRGIGSARSNAKFNGVASGAELRAMMDDAA